MTLSLLKNDQFAQKTKEQIHNPGFYSILQYTMPSQSVRKGFHCSGDAVFVQGSSRSLNPAMNNIGKGQIIYFGWVKIVKNICR